LFALRAALGRPQLLGTNGHFSCGLVETRDIQWDAATQTLSGHARGNGGDPTTLYFHVPAGVSSIEAYCKETVAETGMPQPHVLALQVPATDQFLPWSLRFEGRWGVPTTRPSQAGPAATVK
jgi:hypothetical protein